MSEKVREWLLYEGFCVIIIVYYAKWQHRKNTIIYTKYKNMNLYRNIWI